MSVAGAEPRHALFPTALGVCGVLWREGAILRLQLPEGAPERTRARLLGGRSSDAPESAPDGVAAAAIAGVRDLFDGGRPDLAGLPLDWSPVPHPVRRVLEACRAIPHGETRTYGELARGLGDVSLSRAVGHALGRNPFAPVVPCHRVLGGAGRVGGFSAGEGRRLKLAMLNLERARTGPEPGLFGRLPLAAR